MRLARNACTTVLIVDAQSVKNTDTAALEGDDAGKKVCGIKRHIVVDRQGFPHAVAVTTAEVTDHKGALPAMNRCKANLGKGQSVLADSGSMWVSPLRRRSRKPWGRRSRCRLPSAGLWSAVFPGWTRTGG
jgi:hypothetical protein